MSSGGDGDRNKFNTQRENLKLLERKYYEISKKTYAFYGFFLRSYKLLRCMTVLYIELESVLQRKYKKYLNLVSSCKY